MKARPTLVVYSLLLLLGISEAALAQCEDIAKASKAKSVHGLVVSFEGLASHGRGYVRNGLIAATPSSLSRKFTSMNYPYTRAEEAASCVLDFYKHHGNRLALIVMGHSFGAGISLFEFFQSLPVEVPVRAVLSLDPRSWSSDSTYRRSRDPFVFSLEGYGKRLSWTNFFQTGSFRGYLVKGAKNTLLEGVSHTALPKNAKVQATFFQLLQANL